MRIPGFYHEAPPEVLTKRALPQQHDLIAVRLLFSRWATLTDAAMISAHIDQWAGVKRVSLAPHPISH